MSTYIYTSTYGHTLFAETNRKTVRPSQVEDIDDDDEGFAITPTTAGRYAPLFFTCDVCVYSHMNILQLVLPNAPIFFTCDVRVYSYMKILLLLQPWLAGMLLSSSPVTCVCVCVCVCISHMRIFAGIPAMAGTYVAPHSYVNECICDGPVVCESNYFFVCACMRI